MFAEVVEFVSMLGVGFILALGFRGCDALLSFVADLIKRYREKKP